MASVFFVLSGCNGMQGLSKEKNSVKNVESVVQDKKVQENKPQEIAKVAEKSFNGSLKELMDAGKTAKCSYASDDGKAQYVLYASPTGEARIEGKVGIMDSTAIINREFMYVWSSASNHGVKSNMSDMEAMANKMPVVQNDTSPTGADFYNNEDIKFVCKSWKLDEKKFEIPSDIQFQDISAMMQNLVK